MLTGCCTCSENRSSGDGSSPLGGHQSDAEFSCWLWLDIQAQGLRGLFCALTLTTRHEQATHRHGNDDQVNGNGADHIDGRTQTETGAREDHHRQGGAARAGEEGGDHHFIERQRERQQPGRHQGLRNGRQGDQHEHLERARA